MTYRPGLYRTHPAYEWCTGIWAVLVDNAGHVIATNDDARAEAQRLGPILEDWKRLAWTRS